MQFRSCRGFIAVATAALFMLSALGQNLVASGMVGDAGMTMPVAASDAASHDDVMHCPPSDCSKELDKRMACFAYCTTVFGVLEEPVAFSALATGLQLDSAVVQSLASLHGPPDPPPPKSHA